MSTFHTVWKVWKSMGCDTATTIAFLNSLQDFFSTFFARVILSALFFGAYLQQIAFIGHDLGHNAVTHDVHLDRCLGVLFGPLFSGISIGWWKSTHHLHHAVCNNYEMDPDIQHMPILAVDKVFLKNKYLGDFHSVRNFNMSGYRMFKCV